MAEESTGRTFVTTGILAIVCSLVVSVTAVGLGQRQAVNRELDRKKNILEVAGLYEPGIDVEKTFERVETRIVELETGTYASEGQVPEDYDQRLALSSADKSTAVPTNEDVAGISRREKYSYVYLIRDGQRIDQIVLPVRGRGLFSTLWGFISLDQDLTTVRGITFYQHGETAGLGAEVENPVWKALWPGKRVFDERGEIRLEVIKGTVDANAPDAEYAVDGLSGATMTSKGVSNIVHFWFGETGFGPYLERLQRETDLG